MENTKIDLKKIVIIGAGITGLALAWKLSRKGFKVIVVERQNFVGGLATSILYKGYKIDIGPHYLTIPKNSELASEIKELIGDNEIIELSDFTFEKYYQTFFNERFYSGYPTLWDVIFKSGFSFFIKSIIFFMFEKVKKLTRRTSSNNVKEYLKDNYGDFLYRIWFKPYLQKRYPNNNLPFEEVKKQFPPISFKKLLYKISKNKTTKLENKKYSENFAHIWYFKNGMITLIDALKNKVLEKGGEIILEADIKKILHEDIKKIIFTKNKTEYSITSDAIVYSTPLSITTSWFETSDVKFDFVKNSIPVHSIMVFLLIDSPQLYNSWVVIFYKKELIFSRIAQQNFLSKHVTPKDKTLISVEIRVSESDSTWNFSDSEIIHKVESDLKKTKIIRNEKIDGFKILKLKNLYTHITPLMEKQNEEAIRFINSFKNEFTLGTENDTGTLVESRFDSDKSERIEHGGGIYTALLKAEKLTKVIVLKLKKLES